MTYLQVQTAKTEGGDKASGTKMNFGNFGDPKTTKGDDFIYPDQPIFPYKWANSHFGIRLVSPRSFLKNDTDFGAATFYLQEQFQFSKEEIEATKNYYQKDENKQFWTTNFSAKNLGDPINIRENSGGYIWRVFRNNQSLYKDKRDFLILMLREYGNDEDKMSPENLNAFIKAVNNLPIDLTPERLQRQFFQAEDDSKNEWLKLDKESRPKHKSSNKASDKGSIVATSKRDGPIANDSEQKYNEYEKTRKSRLLNSPSNYEVSSESAVTAINKEIIQKLGFDISDKEGLNQDDFQKRFSKYLNAIMLQQVKYNYVMSQKTPQTKEEFEEYVPQIKGQIEASDGGIKANAILYHYREINSKCYVPSIAEEFANEDTIKPNQVTSSSATAERENVKIQMLKHEETKIQDNIKKARIMQRMRISTDALGQSIWLNGKIPSSLYLSDDILRKIITTPKDKLDYKFLMDLINSGDVNSAFGFRNINRNEKFLDPVAGAEFSEIESYVRSRAQLDKIVKVQEKFLSGKEIIPIQAAILPTAVSKSVLKTVPLELRIYLKKLGKNNWQVIDLTNPTNEKPHKSTATGTSDVDAIENALADFSQDDTSYVPGKFIVRLPLQFAKEQKMMEFPYSGDNWMRIWSERMEAVGNTMNTIGMILRVIPHPFAKMASSTFMLVGQVAGGAKAALNIAERIEKETFAWDLDTLNEGVELVGSISGTLGKKAKGSAKLYFNTTDKLTEVGGYVLIPVNLQNEINKIRNDNTLTDHEKQIKIQNTVKSTVWENGKQIFFDKVTSKISDGQEKNFKRDKGAQSAKKDTEKRANKKVKQQLPQIKVEYKSLGKGKEAQLTSKLKIRLNKDIIINREKRFDKAIKEEKAHIWVKMLYAMEPEVYQATIKRIKDTDQYKDFEKSEIGKDYATIAKQNKYSDAETSDFLAEEFLAKVINKEYSELTFNTAQGTNAYKKLISAIEKLLDSLGLGDGKVSISQLRDIVKSGQKQMDGRGDYITKAKAESILAFFNGEAEIDVSILGKRREKASVHEGASKEILFREMYHLNKNKGGDKNDDEYNEGIEEFKNSTEAEYSNPIIDQFRASWKKKSKSSRSGQKEFIAAAKIEMEKAGVHIPKKVNENELDYFQWHHLIEHSMFDEDALAATISDKQAKLKSLSPSVDKKELRIAKRNVNTANGMLNSVRLLKKLGYHKDDGRLGLPLLHQDYKKYTKVEQEKLKYWKNATVHNGSHVDFYDNISTFYIKHIMDEMGITSENDINNMSTKDVQEADRRIEGVLGWLKIGLINGDIKLNHDKK